MKNTEAAFQWIISILIKHNIRFQVAGGFAARLYGSTRELADIDLDIEEKGFESIFPLVKEYITFGPDQYVDENWNLKLMTLEYNGQVIDIAGEASIFDQQTNKWVLQKTDFENSNLMTVYEMTIPVIQKDALIAYKRKLLREVDIEDINMLTNQD